MMEMERLRLPRRWDLVVERRRVLLADRELGRGLLRGLRRGVLEDKRLVVLVVGEVQVVRGDLVVRELVDLGEVVVRHREDLERVVVLGVEVVPVLELVLAGLLVGLLVERGREVVRDIRLSR